MARINGTQLKRLLNEKFDLYCYSVRRGQGTSSNWWYIDTPEEVPGQIRKQIEKYLVEEKIASTTFTDYGPRNDLAPLILWTHL